MLWWATSTGMREFCWGQHREPCIHGLRVAGPGFKTGAMQHTAYVFDAYGTLFDVHAAVRRHADEIGADGQLLSEIWRAKQLEYSWVRTLMGAYADFWQLTEQALDFALRKVPSADAGLKAKLLDAYWRLDCYPEVPAVLKALKAAGAKLAILSNGSPDMLQAAVKSAALDQVLDDIYSVDAVRRFKTDPSVYDMVATDWRLYPAAISFQSSNRWDIAGATKFGFRTVWINRSNQPEEYQDFAPAMILPSLEALVPGI
jgi:2-haloacid dehalogenase